MFVSGRYHFPCYSPFGEHLKISAGTSNPSFGESFDDERIVYNHKHHWPKNNYETCKQNE